MASTYTANVGVEKIGAGEQAGTWGTTTNNNFDIIDRAINGVGQITLSGTTHTLTTSDGTLSDGQYKVLVLGGSPSGTNTITITPNDQDKLYFVKNSSGQSATFTQGSGANVTIANGKGAIIYADGAGSGAAVTDLTDVFVVGQAIDGVTVGATTPAAITGTTITANTSILPDASGGADIGSTSAEFGDVYIADDKNINFGSDQDVTVGYDETTTDTLKIAAKEGAGLAVTLMADEGDDAGDEWKLNIADGGTLTLANDKNTAGTHVTHMTMTPNSTVASSTVDFAGIVKAAVLGIENSSNDWTFEVSSNTLVFKYGGTGKMKLDSSGNLTVVGNVTAYGSI
tara:strand:+ start:427 stop:1452 length:1026 start_codon:yes stop_codon:yes gene_type:complete